MTLRRAAFTALSTSWALPSEILAIGFSVAGVVITEADTSGSGNAENDKVIDGLGQALKPGYVVWVSREVRTVNKFREYNLPDLVNPAWVYSGGRQDE